MADLGKGPRKPGPPLILGKKKKKTQKEEKPAGQATPPSPTYVKVWMCHWVLVCCAIIV